MPKLLPRTVECLGGLAALAACVSTGVPSGARVTEAGEYEVYNPSACPARVYIAKPPGPLQMLGEVPSGGRMIFAVPRLPPGDRLVASASHPDGTDCDMTRAIQVRRISP